MLLSERSEFQHFPIFCDAQIMLKRSVSTPQGRVYGRLLLLTFLGEARKVSGCRATPDQQTLINKNGNQEQKIEIKKGGNLKASSFHKTSNTNQITLIPHDANAGTKSHHEYSVSQ